MPPSILDAPAATQGLRHAPTTIMLHWTTAVLVVLLWTIGQTIDFVPRGIYESTTARCTWRSELRSGSC